MESQTNVHLGNENRLALIFTNKLYTIKILMSINKIKKVGIRLSVKAFSGAAKNFFKKMKKDLTFINW